MKPDTKPRRPLVKQQWHKCVPERFLAAACPPCFTPDQWALWRARHRGVDVPRAKSYCEDCTPEWQATMLTAKRCIHPEVIFFKDADGFVSGRRPLIKEAK